MRALHRKRQHYMIHILGYDIVQGGGIVAWYIVRIIRHFQSLFFFASTKHIARWIENHRGIFLTVNYYEIYKYIWYILLSFMDEFASEAFSPFPRCFSHVKRNKITRDEEDIYQFYYFCLHQNKLVCPRFFYLFVTVGRITALK